MLGEDREVEKSQESGYGVAETVGRVLKWVQVGEGVGRRCHCILDRLIFLDCIAVFCRAPFSTQKLSETKSTVSRHTTSCTIPRRSWTRSPPTPRP